MPEAHMYVNLEFEDLFTLVFIWNVVMHYFLINRFIVYLSLFKECSMFDSFFYVSVDIYLVGWQLQFWVYHRA